MSLDQNLFTLSIAPNKDDPNVLDLIDPSGSPHYYKERVPGPAYKVNVYDPMSESLLACASSPSSTSKHKTIELYNPTQVVALDYTGRLTFKWSFKWEEHEFEWKREECYMLRKPDPPVLVAITKEPAGRIKTTSVQILDYNLNRFEIEDRKGLEIVILTALLTFADNNDAYHAQDSSSSPTRKASADSPPPPPPPKPAPKTGMARISEMQSLRGEINEVTVEDEGAVDDYAAYCAKLLQDDAMLFITLRSAAAEYVPKVLQVVEQTKRVRHKAGVSDEEGLHQYVLYEGSPALKGPKRINLDGGAVKGKGKASVDYTPPTSLTVHLSKIPMPELQPKAESPPPSSSKEDKKRLREEEKRKKDQKKDQKKERKTSPPRESSKLLKPTAAAPVHSYQTHPYQPSPSPSQLNNPGIYTAPPPPRPPHSPYSHSQPRPNSFIGTLQSGYDRYVAPQIPKPNSFTSGPPSQPPKQGGFMGRFSKRNE